MKKFLITCLTALSTTALVAQNNISFTPIDAPMMFPGYAPVVKGLFAKTVKAGNSKSTLQLNQTIAFKISMYDANDKLMRDFGFQKNVPLKKETFGFLTSAFLTMHEGDSVTLKVNIDSLSNGQAHPGIDNGAFVGYGIKIFSAQDVAVMEQKSKEAAAAKKLQEEATMKKYFADHKITPQRTPEGLYYTITTVGTGELAVSGDNVVANYRGKLFDGTVFDSNMDSAFHHVQPFTFPIQQHRVIQGWDIAFSLLKKGSKATLYIPSALAYGENPPPGGKIQANDPLIFDVELVDIQHPEDQFGKYFKEHNITNAKKTPEGVYYVITSPGTGSSPLPGQTITARYTGKLLDGTVFDSNMNPGGSPFSFTVGQGQVIRGWDIGFQFLNKGAKATLYIPSELAYGASSPAPSIPANSPMIFEVELVDFK